MALEGKPMAREDWSPWSVQEIDAEVRRLASGHPDWRRMLRLVSKYRASFKEGEVQTPVAPTKEKPSASFWSMPEIDRLIEGGELLMVRYSENVPDTKVIKPPREQRVRFCSLCNEPTHTRANCPNPVKIPRVMLDQRRYCRICDVRGHSVTECPTLPNPPLCPICKVNHWPASCPHAYVRVA